jgi:hypothetical protein
LNIFNIRFFFRFYGLDDRGDDMGEDRGGNGDDDGQDDDNSPLFNEFISYCKIHPSALDSASTFGTG